MRIWHYALLALFLVFSVNAEAFAKSETYKFVTLDLPAGWTVASAPNEAFLRLGFTPLYADIMACVFDGNRTTEICAHLNVARGTVKEAKSKSYALLGVHSERELRDKVFCLIADVVENGR